MHAKGGGILSFAHEFRIYLANRRVAGQARLAVAMLMLGVTGGILGLGFVVIGYQASQEITEPSDPVSNANRKKPVQVRKS